MLSKSRFGWPGLIFLVVLVTHCRSEVVTPMDSAYSIHLAVSLLTEGDFDLDEYREQIPAEDYRVLRRAGHLYSRYPTGPSVIALPVVVVVGSFAENVLGLPLAEIVRARSSGVERLCGSLCVAVTALIVFAISRRRLGVWSSLLVVFIFAFCTSSWSVVSRALWQHGPSMVFLSAALWVLLRAREEARFAQYAGFFLAAAYAMRPTNSLAVVLLTLYVAIEHRAWLGRYLGWAALVAIPFLAQHVATFGRLLPAYYRQVSNFHPTTASFLEAAAGTLISPGRGLFVYSPVFLLSVLGALLLARQGRWSRLDTFLAIWLVLHWWMISCFHNWWGGTVFGPRLFADLVPVLVCFLIPVVEQLQVPGRARVAWAAALGLTIVVSFAMHRVGAVDLGPWFWNGHRSGIDDDPSRLWDWRDPPFLHRQGEHVVTPPPALVPPS